MTEAILYEPGSNKSIHCKMCAHYCNIENGDKGKCLTRENIDGRLYTLSYGASTGFAVDPIEKKPFYHFRPGTKALSFGTQGCNFTCKNCQNWTMSQGLRIENLKSEKKITEPEEIVIAARNRGIENIAYTYSEPAIFFEYARDIAKTARSTGGCDDISHVFISNGFYSNELTDMIIGENLADAINIDLKFMDDKKYRDICGGRLKPVLKSIERIFESGIHLEVINLVIPGENDSDDDIQRLIDFIGAVSPEIPLHFSRFYPQYEMAEYPPTAIIKLERAYNKAVESGLRHVFVGNADIPGTKDTICPSCGKTLIKRNWSGIIINEIQQGSKACPYCGYDLYIKG